MEKKEMEDALNNVYDPMIPGAVIDEEEDLSLVENSNVMEEMQELEQANYDELQSPYRPLIGVSGRYDRIIRHFRWRRRRFFYKEKMNLDVDGLYPLKKASGTIKSLFIHSHWIASLKKVRWGCWEGPIEDVYDFGRGKFPYTFVKIQTIAHVIRRSGYAIVTFTANNGLKRTIRMKFATKLMREVEFEFDHEKGINPELNIDPTAHPIHSEALRSEDLTVKKVFERAGFKVRVSTDTDAIPSDGPDLNTTWSDNELHDAMQSYWSRFANIPQWALWTFIGRQHDMGSGLGGIMFDDIGPNHRQGTAVFYDSFISQHPAGDPNGDDWAKRMRFWTTVHEMGHAFNLAHSWQKELGNPWHPSVVNEPDALSFMNYPFRYPGGPNKFFANFEHRFSNQELLFMRHAPEKYVQPGNANWFDNHGFEWTDTEAPAKLMLEVRTRRAQNQFAFMEPVILELKLTNISNVPQVIDRHCLEDLDDLLMIIKKEDKPAMQVKPFAHRCYEDEHVVLEKGKSMYESINISYGPDRWYIDEPGYYDIHCCLRMDEQDILAQKIRVRITPPRTYDENYMAQDIINPDVARVMHFKGSRIMNSANNVLFEAMTKLKSSPVARHAAYALVVPHAKNYQVLERKEKMDLNKICTAVSGGFRFKQLKAEPKEAARIINSYAFAVKDFPDKKSTTAFIDAMGHIDAKKQIETYSSVLANADNREEALAILHQLKEIFTERGVLNSVIKEIDGKIKEFTND